MTKAPDDIKLLTHSNCTNSDVLAIRDALEALSGKWKLPILMALSGGPKRFRQIARDVPEITDKMLSKELKDLETNQLIRRVVFDDFPPAVEYSFTEHALTLQKVMSELSAWGIIHRKQILGK